MYLSQSLSLYAHLVVTDVCEEARKVRDLFEVNTHGKARIVKIGLEWPEHAACEQSQKGEKGDPSEQSSSSRVASSSSMRW